MNADEIIEELWMLIVKEPFSHLREEPDYPNLTNPLHLSVLLLDCDVEIDMNGMLGFIENETGRHLQKTIEALELIGAKKCAEVFKSVENCMAKYHVTWERLRNDYEGTTEFQITSFSKMHGEELDSFSRDVDKISYRFSLFNINYAPEDSYSALCEYLGDKTSSLIHEIEIRRTQQGGGGDGIPPPHR